MQYLLSSFTPPYIHIRLICFVHEGNEDNSNVRLKVVKPNMWNAFIQFV